MTALVDVKLLGANGEILWSVKNLSAHESYQVEVDKVDDEANKQEALVKIARRTSERIVSQMRSNF